MNQRPGRRGQPALARAELLTGFGPFAEAGREDAMTERMIGPYRVLDRLGESGMGEGTFAPPPRSYGPDRGIGRSFIRARHSLNRGSARKLSH